MDRLLATKSEGAGLIVRAISFQDFQPMRSQHERYGGAENAGHENAGHEIDGPIYRNLQGMKIAGPENDGPMCWA